MEAGRESSADGATRLRDCLNDLTSIITVPTVWAAGEPPHAVNTLLDTLLEIGKELDERAAQHTRELAVAAEALRESERDARLVLDSIPGLVALLTADGEVLFLNRQILEYTGRTLEELKQWGTNDIVHPEDLPHVIQIFSRSIASGAPYEITQRLRRSDGVYRWFQNNGFPLRDASGRVVRWCVLLTDVDERKHAEDDLRARERFRVIVDDLPTMVTFMTPDGEFADGNRHMLEYFGASLEELKRRPTTHSFHPDDRPSVDARWKESVETGRPYDFEARLRRADGTYRWFHTRGFPLRDADGRIVLWHLLQTDIDDRKRAEDALRESERESRLIVDSIPGFIAVFTAAGELEFVNRPILEYFGRTLEELKHWGTGGTTHPEDLSRVAERFTRSISSGDPFEFEVRALRFDGVYRWFQSRGFPLRDTNGHIVRWYNLLIDIDERKRAEEALNKAGAELAHVSRVTTFSALTASIAHEVNQPLAGIITNAGTCLRMLDASPPDIDGARETARRTIRDGNRAADVITRLRALFSKRESTLESLDLNEATREVIALSSNDLQRNRIVLQPDLADDLPTVTGDRIQLQQVILNLLRNASDAMVDVHNRPRHLVIRTERENGDRVRLTVRDAGVGLPAQSLDSLFDAFYTTKSGGMGIGLFVSRSIIERHRGRLWAEVNDGPGATFSFSIPPSLESIAAPMMKTS